MLYLTVPEVRRLLLALAEPTEQFSWVQRNGGSWRLKRSHTPRRLTFLVARLCRREHSPYHHSSPTVTCRIRRYGLILSPLPTQLSRACRRRGQQVKPRSPSEPPESPEVQPAAYLPQGHRPRHDPRCDHDHLVGGDRDFPPPPLEFSKGAAAMSRSPRDRGRRVASLPRRKAMPASRRRRCTRPGTSGGG